MFQKNIKYLLNTKQLSVETILKLTGHKSKSIVSMWKSGERYIITEDAVKLANYLNITIDDLINKDLSQIQVSNDFKDYFINNLHLLTQDDIDTTKFFLMMSNRMGHSIGVMQKCYLHLFPTVQDEIVDLLDNL